MVKIQLTDEQIPLLLRCLSDGINGNLTFMDEMEDQDEEEIAASCKDWHWKYTQLYTNLCYQIELYEEEEDEDDA